MLLVHDMQNRYREKRIHAQRRVVECEIGKKAHQEQGNPRRDWIIVAHIQLLVAERSPALFGHSSCDPFTKSIIP